MRTLQVMIPVAAAVAALAAGATAALANGTTRIETRPFYGAVVTIEEGVRVFRPLPPTERVIINPGGVTPLSLGFNETTVTERRYNYNYGPEAKEEAPSQNVYGVGGYYGYGRRGYRGNGDGGSHYGGGLPGRGVR